MINQLSPDAIRTTERYFWVGTSYASINSLFNRLTLAAVSKSPASVWVRAQTSANGRGTSVALSFTVATTSRLLACRFLNVLQKFYPVHEFFHRVGVILAVEGNFCSSRGLRWLLWWWQPVVAGSCRPKTLGVCTSRILTWIPRSCRLRPLLMPIR